MFKGRMWVLAGLGVGLGLVAWWAMAPVSGVFASGVEMGKPAAPVPVALPNEACAGCHQEIYERYRSTPMGRASGPAGDGFLAADFTHAASGIRYRISREGGKVFLSFERGSAENGLPVAAGGAEDSLKGRRELQYFLGSGKRGRTYLFEQEGYWFEIPINWYAKKGVWDMAPGYLNASEMPLTLPVDPGCLRCHASGAQASLPAARNKYAAEPFTQGGITCTACHDGRIGAGAAEHVASGGRVALAKIGSLAPVERDSVCLNCHLEGEAAVVHAGKRLVDFRPGESVFDYASFFVRKAQAGGGERATSQWEALLESGCRRGAGVKLTCTSCHDPHASTAAMSVAERVEFYRGKCLACHEGAAELPSHPGRDDAATRVGRPFQDDASKTAGGFGATHHAENRDCAACHMPRATSKDIAHEQVTDHRIPRIGKAVSVASGGSVAGGEFVPIGNGLAGELESGPGLGRDLGLAYAMAAVKGDRAAGERAMVLLREAENSTTETVSVAEAGDWELHGQLGFLEQVSGDSAGAAKEYELALAADPEDAFAAGNLALIRAGAREYGAAERLWERAFEEDPVQLKAGMNLALVECGLGRKEAALGTLDRLLSFSPDHGPARELAKGIRLGTHACGKRS